jgi:hypothetical protein
MFDFILQLMNTSVPSYLFLYFLHTAFTVALAKVNLLDIGVRLETIH